MGIICILGSIGFLFYRNTEAHTEAGTPSHRTSTDAGWVVWRGVSSRTGETRNQEARLAGGG